MSKKRTSSEANNNEQTNEGSDPVYQQENNPKRARLASSSDTTLQDLPIEILERILVKTVAMEVIGTKLAKSVWKDRVDPVISRLRTVCSQWSSILTTTIFRNEVHRILDGTAQETTRLDILSQAPIQFAASDLTTIKDEIFILSGPNGQDCVINVYDRNNLAKVKEVITLSGIRTARSIEACGVSNCVYVLNEESNCLSVLRVTKDEGHHFNITPWISDLALADSNMSVSANGSLILSLQNESGPAEISIYNVNGLLQNHIVLTEDIYGGRYVESVIQKSNGNLVMLSLNNHIRSELLEIDLTGRIVHQYQPSTVTWQWAEASFLDSYDRMFLNYPNDRIELFDSEFNILKFTGPRIYKGQYIDPRRLHYNSERNEVVSILKDDNFKNGFLTIFRFTEE